MRREVYIVLFLGFVAVCARPGHEERGDDRDDCECDKERYHKGRDDGIEPMDERDDMDSDEEGQMEGCEDWENMAEEEKRECMRRKHERHEQHEQNKKCCEHHWGKEKSLNLALGGSAGVLIIVAVAVGYWCYRQCCKKNCKTTPESKYRGYVSQILSVPPVETVSEEKKYPLPEGDVMTSVSPPPPYTNLPGHDLVLVSPPPYETYPTAPH